MCSYLCAVLIPPISVCLRRGCGCDVLINIALTVLGCIPGMLHACYIVGKTDQARSVASEIV